MLKLGSAGMGDLLGRKAPRWGRTLELSMLRTGQFKDGWLTDKRGAGVRRTLGRRVLRLVQYKDGWQGLKNINILFLPRSTYMMNAGIVSITGTINYSDIKLCTSKILGDLHKTKIWDLCFISDQYTTMSQQIFYRPTHPGSQMYTIKAGKS